MNGLTGTSLALSSSVTSMPTANGLLLELRLDGLAVDDHVETEEMVELLVRYGGPVVDTAGNVGHREGDDRLDVRFGLVAEDVVDIDLAWRNRQVLAEHPDGVGARQDQSSRPELCHYIVGKRRRCAQGSADQLSIVQAWFASPQYSIERKSASPAGRRHRPIEPESLRQFSVARHRLRRRLERGSTRPPRNSPAGNARSGTGTDRSHRGSIHIFGNCFGVHWSCACACSKWFE